MELRRLSVLNVSVYLCWICHAYCVALTRGLTINRKKILIGGHVLTEQQVR
jgi:hypothetical protein